jgi:DNA-binding transcriptional MocR family regulator
VRFFGDYDGIIEQMRKHAAIIRPKFEAVLEILERELGADDFAHWTSPRGGYFISLDTKPGLAKKVVAMAAELGVKLTAAGATYPLRKDPEDRNIRIAPTLPGLDEIKLAVEVMAVCIKIASLEQAA